MWRGANQQRVSKQQQRRSRRRRENVENVEVILQRFRKGYAAAMDCVAAMHRLGSMTAATATTSSNSDNDQLRQVMHVARKTFENVILYDPIVLTLVPAIAKSKRSCHFSNTKTLAVSSGWTALSASHQKIIQEIVYLTLVNYADLLMAGLPPASSSATASSSPSSTSILDRGVIKRVTCPFHNNQQNIWLDASTGHSSTTEAVDVDVDVSETLRRIVAAYLDAVALDASDPTVYLKLAIAARRLDRIRTHRLQRHALERATKAALVVHPWQNRTAQRAWNEFQQQEQEVVFETYNQSSHEDTTTPPPVIVINVPRDSWLTMARLVLRTCTNLTHGSAVTVAATHSKHTSTTSPGIRIHLSPLIGLSTSLWARIFPYLDGLSRSNCEMTCRALHTQLLLARAKIANEIDASQRLERQRQRLQQQQQQQNTMSSFQNADSESNKSIALPTTIATTLDSNDDNNDNNNNALHPTVPDTSGTATLSAGAQKRVSKRVRSQLITSGKRSERMYRRNSIEFCLLAATLGKPQRLERFARLRLRWGKIVDRHDSDVPIAANEKNNASWMTTTTTTTGELAFQNGSASSLTSFIRWYFPQDVVDQRPLTPTACLFTMLAHISMHIDHVFSSETGGVASLTSCLLECLDWMVRQTKLREAGGSSLVSSWSLSPQKVPRHTRLGRLEHFAVDLLHVELRLKRCNKSESEGGTVVFDFDGDENFLSMIVPALCSVVEEIDESQSQSIARIHEMKSKIWKCLKVRFFWLAANFFLWRERICLNVGESRIAESEGLHFVEKARACLRERENAGRKVLSEVKTPHLESPKRKGIYWKALSVDSLNIFIDEVQASSVVLRAQEQFLHVISKYSKGGVESNMNEIRLEDEDAERLFEIGKMLLARYEGANAKYSELVDDLLTVHGDKILLSSFDKRLHAVENNIVDAIKNGLVDFLFPLTIVDTPICLLRVENPCILSILVTCLSTKAGTCKTIVELLVQMVSVVIRLAKSTSERIKSRKDVHCDEDSFDDMLDVDSITSDDEDGLLHKNSDQIKMQKYATIVGIFLEKIYNILRNEWNDVQKSVFAPSRCLFETMLHDCLLFAAEWYECSGAILLEESTAEDTGLFLMIEKVYREITSILPCTSSLESLSRVFLSGLISIVDSQRFVLQYISCTKTSSKRRTERMKATRKRADLVAVCCCQAGLLLSKNLCIVESGEMNASKLFLDADQGNDSSSKIALFCDALLWLWKACCNTDTNDSGAGKAAETAHCLDKFGRERLRIPVSTALIALCGSASTTMLFSKDRDNENVVQSTSDPISLIEFYDSDASAIEWVAEDGQPEDSLLTKKKENLLRVLSQAIHCVCQVFVKVDEKEALEYSYGLGYVTENGPTLPLVVCRVLNMFSEQLLVEFSEGELEDSSWSNYPFGTRTVGTLLDSALHKAYKCLHGFSLTHASEKDSSLTTINTPTPKIQTFPPEDTRAAVFLFRCIMRAYSQTKKTPPKAALDVVLVSLPKLQESKKASAIQNYLFNPNLTDVALSGLVSLVTKQSNWESCFSEIEGFFWTPHADNDREVEDESAKVRRGIAKLMAQGAIPQCQDCADENIIRHSTIQTEEELSQKFFAVVDDLCFGDSGDCEGWYKASQCLTIKADLIADRLGLSKGFARGEKFCFDGHFSVPDARGMSLADLIHAQEREMWLKEEGWLQCISDDLSVFARYSWSSFDSLRECSLKIGSAYQRLPTSNGEGLEDRFHERIWTEIEILNAKKNFVSWQEAWGGLFVSALRKVSLRCLSLALYTAHKTDSEESNLISEIAESMGVNLYSELMGSQMYGYPMHEMVPYRKRKTAEAALSCFDVAINVVESGNDKSMESDSARDVWDLHFMKGKCHEKIAATFNKESFPITNGDPDCIENRHCRQYERHISLSLASYSTSLIQALDVEKNGGFVTEQNGGSAHGSVEAFYRLHASRLKCLIVAVNKKEDERMNAELEALRLTEMYWYKDPNREDESRLLTVRDRVWRVLEDVIAALSRCRLDHSYFHRSVYRHAQALMWAPILYDPLDGRNKGSLGTVSATWACKIRGLNYATNAASSAHSVMSCLFEKKRPQLVAVWVTSSGSPSAFQTINGTIRKYDSLRGKYISAYIDCLRLCLQRKELETMLRSTLSCPRDLPSFFAASASSMGGKPLHPHSRDCLVVKNRSLSSRHFLVTAKRQANSGLASVILEELKQNPEEASKADSKYYENKLKLAYACFLRLHCRPDDILKHRSWKYSSRTGVKDIIEALVTAFLKLSEDHPIAGTCNDWSGQSHTHKLLDASLAKCKTLFPTVTSNFYFSRRQKTPLKEKTRANRNNDASNLVKKLFEVAVPQGVKAGETFITTIPVGEQRKKVRLTVPPGDVTTLRFSLEVPDDFESSEHHASKRARATEDD